MSDFTIDGPCLGAPPLVLTVLRSSVALEAKTLHATVRTLEMGNVIVASLGEWLVELRIEDDHLVGHAVLRDDPVDASEFLFASPVPKDMARYGLWAQRHASNVMAALVGLNEKGW